MKWNETSQRKKVPLILEQVMGWEVFSGWYSFASKYEQPMGSGHWLITSGPVAVGTRHTLPIWRVFDPNHEFLHSVFDPLHDRGDAQLLLERIYEYKGLRAVRFASYLLGEEIEPDNGELPWPYWMEITIKHWEPEQICRAAYESIRR